MKTFALLLLLTVALTSFPVHAQDDAPPSKFPPIPPGPLIQERAPDYSQWTVTTKLGGDSSSTQPGTAPAASKQPPFFGAIVTTTQTGKIKLRETTDNLGQIWSTWCVRSDTQITIRPDTKGVIITSGPVDPRNPSPYYVDYSKTDFPNIPSGVVSLSNYAGIQSSHGAQCLLFKGSGSIIPRSPAIPCTVYINLKSRYPVAVEGAGIVVTYEFHQPPSAELSPSADVVQVLKNIDLINRSVGVKPNR